VDLVTPEVISPAVACSRICPHALRLRVTFAQLAHLNHKVKSVAEGISRGDLAPTLAVAILTRAMHETAAMWPDQSSSPVPHG
jgi:hypothetical protein